MASSDTESVKLSKSWTTVTPLSKLLALILFIALPFLGFWLGLNMANNPTSTFSESKILEEKSCTDNGCVFEDEFGRGGYASLRGYYHQDSQRCDSITVTQSSTALDQINGKYAGGATFSLDLSKLSNNDKNKILASSKNKVVELFVFWPSKSGSGIKGCEPSRFEIIRVS